MASTRTLRSSSPSPAWGRPRRPGARRVRRRPARYADAKARKNYAGTSPITRPSGKKKIVLARYVHNDRLVDALSPSLRRAAASPGARAYYDQLRARGIGHHAALRQLGNRLVGILHGCLKTGTLYNEATAWPITHQTGRCLTFKLLGCLDTTSTRQGSAPIEEDGGK